MIDKAPQELLCNFIFGVLFETGGLFGMGSINSANKVMKKWSARSQIIGEYLWSRRVALCDKNASKRVKR